MDVAQEETAIFLTHRNLNGKIWMMQMAEEIR